MKVVVFGATGLVGSHVARTCLDEERITKVFIITRKGPIVEIAKSPKVEVILHRDFESWPVDLMKRLDGVEACLWAVGGAVEMLNNDKDYCRKVNVDFTWSFAQALNSSVVPMLPDGKEFRFVFCSGATAERDQDRTLLFLSDTRKIKGEIERRLCELADAETRFETFLLRPAMIQDQNTGVVRRAWMRALGLAVDATEVGNAMVKIGVEGTTKRIVENADILKA
ncbi:hypothetical protein DER45DRAFT_609606 [Fusarium avenaceum]|nr:hypothetical protein DER45DRAFT_609606 [Fusarium avenaceum]